MISWNCPRSGGFSRLFPYVTSCRTEKICRGSTTGGMSFSPPIPTLSVVTHAGVIFLLRVNFGRGRQIPNPVSERKEKILVHRSVKTRMDANLLERGKYNPKAKFEYSDVEWVD